ncbi:restriction endonuclease subunit S [Marmoricola sp. RAF53]|uniref:restriction endonuclease subunit S n=1 Tax=Marmoricola sp. RAF53 TaxID=3233059 RepID=UPI003F9D8F3D
MSIAMGRLAAVNPPVPEFMSNPDVEVTFLPLECVWPDGRADLTRRVSAEVVANGYTQFRDGDVLVPKITPTFEAGRVVPLRLPTPLGAGTTELHVLRPNPGVDARYLAYVCRSQPFLQDGASRLQGVGNLRRVPADFLFRYPVEVVDRVQQRAIADYLDGEIAQVDTLIGEQQRLIDLLRERRNATITAALTGWPLTRLRRIVDPTRPMTYGILQPGEQVADGVPYLQPADLALGVSPSRESLARTTPEISKVYARSLVRGGDHVVSIGPGYGKVAYLAPDLDGVNISRDCVRVAIRSDAVDPDFLIWALRSRGVADYWDEQITGSTFRRLNLGTLARTPIPLPSLEEQKRVVAQLHDQVSRIDALAVGSERLIALSRERRAALITAAVTGQIDVGIEVA